MEFKFETPVLKEDRLLWYESKIITKLNDKAEILAYLDDRIIGSLTLDGSKVEGDIVVKEKLLRHAKDHFREKGSSRKLSMFGREYELGSKFKKSDFKIKPYHTKYYKECCSLFCQSWISLIDLYATLEPWRSKMLKDYVDRSLEEDFRDIHHSFEAFFVVTGPEKGRVYGQVAIIKGGELKRLAVHPSARGMGLAKDLCRAVEEYCWKAGYEKVFLTTGSFMPQAVRLYFSLGYKNVKKHLYNVTQYNQVIHPDAKSHGALKTREIMIMEFEKLKNKDKKKKEKNNNNKNTKY